MFTQDVLLINSALFFMMPMHVMRMEKLACRLQQQWEYSIREINKKRVMLEKKLKAHRKRMRCKCTLTDNRIYSQTCGKPHTHTDCNNLYCVSINNDCSKQTTFRFSNPFINQVIDDDFEVSIDKTDEMK